MKNTRPETRPVHDLVGDPPATNTVAQKRAARETYDAQERVFYDEHHTQIWHALAAGARLRRVDSDWALVIKPPRAALEYVARFLQDQRVPDYQRVPCEGVETYGDVFPADMSPGWPDMPDEPPSPNASALAVELVATAGPRSRSILGFTQDEHGLVIHSPTASSAEADAMLSAPEWGPGTTPQIRRAHEGRGWPSTIDAVEVAMREFLSDSERRSRNAILVALSDDTIRSAWVESMTRRPETIDAFVLNEAREGDDASLIRWATEPNNPTRMRLARASLALAQRSA